MSTKTPSPQLSTQTTCYSKQAHLTQKPPTAATVFPNALLTNRGDFSFRISMDQGRLLSAGP
jgi:hypothetical protein